MSAVGRRLQAAERAMKRAGGLTRLTDDDRAAVTAWWGWMAGERNEAPNLPDHVSAAMLRTYGTHEAALAHLN